MKRGEMWRNLSETETVATLGDAGRSIHSCSGAGLRKLLLLLTSFRSACTSIVGATRPNVETLQNLTEICVATLRSILDPLWFLASLAFGSVMIVYTL